MRERNRENEKDGRYECSPKQGEPAMRQRDSQQSDNEGQRRQNKNRAQLADGVHEHCHKDDDRAGPRRLSNACEEGITTPPQEPRRSDRYEKSVAIFLLGSPA